jgi:hypothetical protein
MGRNRRQRQTLLVILLAALVLCLLTVIVQAREMGFERLQEGGFQVQNHEEVLQGKRGNPFQYRILSEWIVEGFIQAFKAWGIPSPSAVGFLAFRILQNILIFTLAAYYYRKLGLNQFAAILGISLLAWSFTQALYGADLQFNTYGDILFYLAAGLAIAHRRVNWVIPITFLAAFNRETSLLIPFLLVAAYIEMKPTISLPRNIFTVVGVSLALFAVVFIGLRIAFGPQELIVPYGYHIGMELFTYNLTLPATYIEVFGVLGLLPIMAIVARKQWPDLLVRFFWALVPIWFVVHLFASILAESRLLLVPQALIFIPGALFGVVQVRSGTTG